MCHILYVAGQLGVTEWTSSLSPQHHPRLHPTPPWLTPSPSPSSSDTSSWQPAPFNSLQHLLGLANHWCSAPSMATTPAPSLVGLSHLRPYDGEIWRGRGVSSYFPKQLKVLWKERRRQWLESNHVIDEVHVVLKLWEHKVLITKTFVHAGNAL